MFIPDSRSVGGKTLLNQHLDNHYKKITSVKAASTKKGKIDHRRKKNPLEFSIEPFNTISKVIQIQESKHKQSQPKCFPLRSNNLPSTHLKPKTYEEIEHNKMLKKMNEIIYKPKTLEHRKRDPFDPVGNPAYFFRKETESLKPISVYHFAKELVEKEKLEENFLYHFDECYKLNESFDLEKTTTQKKIPKSQRLDVFQNFHQVKPLTKNGLTRECPGLFTENFMVRTFEDYCLYQGAPIVLLKDFGDEKEALKSLKMKLIKVILAFRLHKEEDFDNLFWRVMKGNMEIDPTEMKLMLMGLKNDFETPLN